MGTTALTPRRLTHLAAITVIGLLSIPPVRRATGRLHDDLVYRTYCKPGHGIVGQCEPDKDPYLRIGLGMRPACRWCHRETRNP